MQQWGEKVSFLKKIRDIANTDISQLFQKEEKNKIITSEDSHTDSQELVAADDVDNVVDSDIDHDEVITSFDAVDDNLVEDDDQTFTEDVSEETLVEVVDDLTDVDVEDDLDVSDMTENDSTDSGDNFEIAEDNLEDDLLVAPVVFDNTVEPLSIKSMPKVPSQPSTLFKEGSFLSKLDEHIMTVHFHNEFERKKHLVTMFDGYVRSDKGSKVIKKIDVVED
ncbi:hypothetical protein DID76_00930 [Candidatus Marinamargulisbacteria bacterium SCGC AG-414-C22]|nr:hypothetical protein DID76_00930 [Candidatus Marinamargulisbacteria bacterium SCGC AG-414-C22]